MIRVSTAILVVIVAMLQCGCGGVRLYGECAPPTPHLDAMQPTSLPAHLALATLTVFGSNFVPTSVVFFNTHAIPTTFVSSQELKASIPLESLNSPGQVPVDVFNPADANACPNYYSQGRSRSSNSLNFTITPAP
jgi:hypothetical protein